MRIVLARHGETVWHAENRYAGRSDIALTVHGLEQTKLLAEWARDATLAAVWSSPLSRARVTAQTAADAAGHSLQIDERLIELDFGRGEGKTDTEMYAEFAEERAAFVRDPVKNYLPGGEDPAEAAVRGARALFSIANAAAPQARVLVVAHSTLLRLVLCQMLHIPLARYREAFPSFSTGALTEISIHEKKVGLLSYNVPLRDSLQRDEEHA